ncbi:hypothetical protein [Hydrogenophaga sp. BPS33]|uniref:hypothetical protein n=1 Tax=Hydrogenophaga sp. BPS33 TaxID=2651974 RepID=UPI0013201C25|nr:hypothetical protein [Hydrogenophaga sp. BPS33]QHE85183.1 hypothetical protein F9K07_09930 [Hydrogenophaga sp. BPS33]
MKYDTVRSKQSVQDAPSSADKKEKTAQPRAGAVSTTGKVTRFLKLRAIELTMSKEARANQKLDVQSLKLVKKELEDAMRSMVDPDASEGAGVAALRTACASLKYVVTRHPEVTQDAVNEEESKARLTQRLCGALLREVMPTLTPDERLALRDLSSTEVDENEMNEVIDEIRFSAKGELLRRATQVAPGTSMARDKDGHGLDWSTSSAEQCDQIHALASDLIQSAKAFPRTKGVIAGTQFTLRDLEEIRSRSLKLVVRAAWSTVDKTSASQIAAMSKPELKKLEKAARTMVENTNAGEIAKMSKTELVTLGKAVQFLDARRASAFNLDAIKPVVEVRIRLEDSISAAKNETDVNKKLDHLLHCADLAAYAKAQFGEGTLDLSEVIHSVSAFFHQRLRDVKLSALTDAKSSMDSLLEENYPDDLWIRQLSAVIQEERSNRLQTLGTQASAAIQAFQRPPANAFKQTKNEVVKSLIDEVDSSSSTDS